MENKWMAFALTRTKFNIIVYGNKFNNKTNSLKKKTLIMLKINFPFPNEFFSGSFSVPAEFFLLMCIFLNTEMIIIF